MDWKAENLKVPGFLASGIRCGIKVEKGRKDLALLYSTSPAKIAGMFTTNCFKAAPVVLCRERIGSGLGQAVIVNSGNANAANGNEGYRAARAMSRAVSKKLRIDDELVYVASTGVIGNPLPVDKVLEGVPHLVRDLSETGIYSAEEAIMTTDRFPKIGLGKFKAGSTEVTVCGIAKGAGMIEPDMATLLSFVLTDLEIDIQSLRKTFRSCIGESFNAISVDGCMSTNDTALILANGAAANKSPGTAGLRKFRDCLAEVLSGLALAMVRDGEGATKAVRITVEGAATRADAKKIAYKIAGSNLVKTAFFGQDPNWGRIISAAGAAGIKLPADSVEVAIGSVPVFRKGRAVRKDADRLLKIMTADSFEVKIKIGMGNAAFSMHTSDLTYDYVKLNAHYHT
ncbi:MAG: bifunctional glutamate N-acetyltransferase/amino-acid acetyltransferase ArgJ [Syntrophaceae bacterium]